MRDLECVWKRASPSMVECDGETELNQAKLEIQKLKATVLLLQSKLSEKDSNSSQSVSPDSSPSNPTRRSTKSLSPLSLPAAAPGPAEVEIPGLGLQSSNASNYNPIKFDPRRASLPAPTHLFDDPYSYDTFTPTSGSYSFDSIISPDSRAPFLQSRSFGIHSDSQSNLTPTQASYTTPLMNYKTSNENFYHLQSGEDLHHLPAPFESQEFRFPEPHVPIAFPIYPRIEPFESPPTTTTTTYHSTDYLNDSIPLPMSLDAFGSIVKPNSFGSFSDSLEGKGARPSLGYPTGAHHHRAKSDGFIDLSMLHKLDFSTLES